MATNRIRARCVQIPCRVGVGTIENIGPRGGDTVNVIEPAHNRRFITGHTIANGIRSVDTWSRDIHCQETWPRNSQTVRTVTTLDGTAQVAARLKIKAVVAIPAVEVFKCGETDAVDRSFVHVCHSEDIIAAATNDRIQGRHATDNLLDTGEIADSCSHSARNVLRVVDNVAATLAVYGPRQGGEVGKRDDVIPNSTEDVIRLRTSDVEAVRQTSALEILEGRKCQHAIRRVVFKSVGPVNLPDRNDVHPGDCVRPGAARYGVDVLEPANDGRRGTVKSVNGTIGRQGH